MEAEDGVVDNSSEREVVEELSEVNPDIRVAILSKALIVEAVDLSNLSDLVVTSEDGNSVLEPHLQSDQERDSLDRVVATIDVITHEEVVGIWRLAANSKELFQIMELAMNVTADCDRGSNSLDVGLIDQDLLSLLAQGPDGFFRKRLALKEGLDLSIKTFNVAHGLNRRGHARGGFGTFHN